MSGEWWAPKPLRNLNLSGIFSHGNPEMSKEAPNPYSEQRTRDGSPHTTGAPTALRPPPAGPKLFLDDLSKAKSTDLAPKKARYDAEAVVKAFLASGE
jgi:hypothetical protein